MPEVRCVVPTGDWTGEGATWHAGERALYWVDIGRFLIHRLDSLTGSVRTWFFTEPPSALGLTDRADTLVVAIGGRLVLWQPVNDARAELAAPEKNWPRARLNDGRPDPAGNFWVGSMGHGFAEDGSEIAARHALGRLFRITGSGAATVEKADIGISNTLCWSPDNTRFYFGDTITGMISVWDYDVRTGTIANQRPFFGGFNRGGPDGSAMDRDGYLWNARYGGSCVVRIAPDGSIDRIVELPVNAVTTCTFGGPLLKTLYITSAWQGFDAAQRAADPLAGALFSVQAGVAGVPAARFG
jgi:sugar lactone lactonase YvrE